MLFFFVALTAALSVSFLLYFSATRALVLQQNPIIANAWAQQRLMETHWEVFGDSGTRADTTVKNDFRNRMEDITRRLRTKDIHTEFIANPEKLEDLYNIGTLDTDKKNAKKALTEKQWKRFPELADKFPIYSTNFNAENSVKFFDRTAPGGTYRYFEEVRMDSKSDCILCHKAFVEGELMGIVHVVVPKKLVGQTTQRYLAYMLAAGIMSVFLSLVAVNIVVRKLVIKPLRKLRNSAETIARGDMNKRADIHTGDEFETLAGAFNRMLQHLAQTQTRLRNANTDLEGKVNELANQTVRLHEMNRIKSEFMATMSHELRTPLNSILGFSDVLNSISTLTDKQKRYVENINKSGKSLLAMVNDILDLAKMESGRMDTQITQFSIATVMSAQLDMTRPLADKKNIQLAQNVADHLPMMTQDASKIQQILNNLLSNAIKFTPEGGRITVSVKMLLARPLAAPAVPAPVAGAVPPPPLEQDFLELIVQDTGVGISEEDQKIIFDKFRQGTGSEDLSDPLKREHSGSGLGLSIVREICRVLDGEISVSSQLGVGSIFTVHLPWELQSKPQTVSQITTDIRQFAGK